ncbi:MAG TPA: EAL domain-containing protein, partial [bacterium]|nr:EAL domain-containing protein [bacterium]
NHLKSPAIAGIIVNAHDITGQKAVEEALRENMERYELVARGSNGGLWDWNLRTGEVYFSPRWKSILGYKENEIGSKPDDWFELVHPEDVAHLKSAILDHLEGRTEFLEFEHRVLRKSGDYLWMGVRGIAVRGADGKAARLAGSQTDISRQKGVEEMFKFQALHDTLTGLANRTLLFDRLQQAIRRARRSDFKFAVLFLDVDRFKGVNDSLGHLAGDLLLKESSNRLEKCLRPGDTAARLGGDEFTILLENLKDVKEAVQVAERVLKELAKPCRLNDQEVFATVSIGIAMCNGNYSRPEDLLRDADTALYRAKANGRARYEIFDVDMHNRAVALLQMENDLWRAINNTEFLIHYQPILSLRTGFIVGFEALARWQHPEKGLLSPNDFIPLAEETGLIINIGEWLLKAACQQNRIWQTMGFPNLRLAVNFSARQLRHPDPLKMIQDILWETHMNAQTLELEITESIAMRTSDPGFGALSKLRLMGVPISIDDFGTGYSSLSSLKHSPASTLKIDKSFLKDIQSDPDNAAITNTIIAMAHSLQLRVIAEGVETEEQLRFLADRGCDEVQGHYFSPPLDAARATDLLLQSNPFPLKQKLPTRLPQN